MVCRAGIMISNIGKEQNKRVEAQTDYDRLG